MKPNSQVRLSADQMQIVRALADNSMNVSQTARELYRNRSGLRYQIQRIYERTGLDPMNFYDLHALLYAGEGRSDEDL